MPSAAQTKESTVAFRRRIGNEQAPPCDRFYCPLLVGAVANRSEIDLSARIELT